MNRSFITRLFGLAAATVALMVGLFAGGATAQIARNVPDSNISASAEQLTQINPMQPVAAPLSTGGVFIDGGGVGVQQAESCGFWFRHDNYYTHCGYNSIVIRVEFVYGWNGTRDITVWPGRSNISRHGALQNNGFITNAWCVKRC